MSKECLRTGDKALIHFRFIKHPEYMVAGQRMVFREGRTKAVGNVVRIFTQSTNSAVGNKIKPTKQQQQQQHQRPATGSEKLHNYNNCSASSQNHLEEVILKLICNSPNYSVVIISLSKLQIY